MAAITIQPARAEDFHAIFALHEECFRPHIEQIWGWDAEWQRADFAQSWATCGTRAIHAENALIGYVQVQSAADHLYLKNLGLTAAHRGRGIGTGIVRDLQARASAAGLPLRLAVFVTNPAAERLYRRLGLHAVARDARFVTLEWNSIDHSPEQTTD